MTERVDFYVLKSAAARQRLTFACRLTEKAYLQNLSVVVVSDTAADADALDELLWTFSERSFVPHERSRGPPAGGGPAPVQLTPDPAGTRAGGGPAPVQLTPDPAGTRAGGGPAPVQLTPDPAGTRAGGGAAPVQLTPDSAGTRTGSGPAPVQLTPDPEAIDSADLLVNLSARLPARWQRFARIAEVIDADEERRRLGRERFKIYRDSKLTVETHQLDDAASG